MYLRSASPISIKVVLLSVIAFIWKRYREREAKRERRQSKFMKGFVLARSYTHVLPSSMHRVILDSQLGD